MGVLFPSKRDAGDKRREDGRAISYYKKCEKAQQRRTSPVLGEAHTHGNGQDEPRKQANLRVSLAAVFVIDSELRRESGVEVMPQKIRNEGRGDQGQKHEEAVEVDFPGAVDLLVRSGV